MLLFSTTVLLYFASFKKKKTVFVKRKYNKKEKILHFGKKVW